MVIIHTQNAHHGLKKGLQHLLHNSIEQDSRNGPVVRAETPVTTVYHQPLERVVFWPERDANPFFHFYEALWMLGGRNDVRSVARYAKQMLQYSDDGTTIHDAYGHRWRKWFGRDQLEINIEILKKNKLDRQCVVQMWDSTADLNRAGKAVPCNMICTFQVDPVWGKLDMTVFCRSNDIIWGTYGANAVHFGFLLEYMSVRTGIPAGKYNQISVNYHAYKDQFEKNLPILDSPLTITYPRVIRMPDDVDDYIDAVLDLADNNSYPTTSRWVTNGEYDVQEWYSMANRMMWAHQAYRGNDLDLAREILHVAPRCDWTIAGEQWLMRRIEKRRSASAEFASKIIPGVV